MLYAILAYLGGTDSAVSSVWRWVPPTMYYGTIAGVGLGTLALAIVWVFQRDLVYPAAFPAQSRERVSLPSQFGMPHFDDIRLETPDKVVIRGYLIKQATDEETKRAPTLIYFHANAGNMGHRLPIAKMIYDSVKCNVFMLSYRGYGLSDGRPSEAGLRTDAVTALEFIRSHPLTANTKLVAYGQSIGGAVAIDIVAAHEAEFAGLVLENTFLSIPKLIPNVLPILKHVTFLASEKWDSEAAVQRIASVPILFLSGLQDELVPPPHMRQLFALASQAESSEKPRVTWNEFPRGNHNDTCVQPTYYDCIAAWWRDTVDQADPYVPTGRLATLEARKSVERSDGENTYSVQSASVARTLSDSDRDNDKQPAAADLAGKKDN
ncbi:bem46 protein, variant [Coemansia sp. RSA 2708]|nr:bem46 protein, variant [Coemansia sp. RSA 2708]